MKANNAFLYEALCIDQLVAQLAEDDHHWAELLPTQINDSLNNLKHGKLEHWLEQLQNAPKIDNIALALDQQAVTLTTSSNLSKPDSEQLLTVLQNLKPWRKGPYHLFGIDIDTEWRSDLKWDRIANYLDLKGKTILDVGCANGYFGWRMLAAGAKSVIGIDPGLLFIIQFLLIKHYAQQASQKINHTLLPFRLEDLPNDLNYFDTVFSMGVLYHRRSVFDHLFELKQCIKPGGELVLETLVIPQEYGEVLVPKDRYARMRNVWFIPNSKVLCDWLARAGFVDIRIIDESPTLVSEQRKTKWIDSESLENCLDRNDPSLTIEGYPAPRRATILARYEIKVMRSIDEIFPR